MKMTMMITRGDNDVNDETMMIFWVIFLGE